MHSHCTPTALPLHSHCTPTALCAHSAFAFAFAFAFEFIFQVEVSTAMERNRFSPRSTNYSCSKRYFHAMPIRDRVLTSGIDLGMSQQDVQV